MPENEENTPRVRKIKGHKDPFDELMGISSSSTKKIDGDDDPDFPGPGDDDDGDEPDDEPAPGDDDEPGEEPDEEPGDDSPPMFEEKSVSARAGSEDEDYANLLMEQGIEEEGIHGDEMSGDAEEEMEIPTPHSNEPDAKVNSREAIKQNLILKSRAHAGVDPSNTMKLDLLEMPDKKAIFIGRKKSVMQKSGLDGALYVGKIQDEEKFREHKLYLDSLNPHVVFVCGARGSGKSYVLGVMAEELALKNPNVGIVVVDPVGVFWSMKYPNKEDREVRDLAQFELMPQGLENMKVFIPEGMKSETPKSTYDALFSIPPALLTSEDWCLTFGIDRFSPTGLLMEKALKKVEKGYRSTNGETIKAKKGAYSLSELILCLETDAELNSKEKGYKTDSVRALVSRFEAAKSWGIFSEKGTPLAELSRANQLTVIDTSFLDDTVTALVIGILARRLLAARKLQTRKEAANEAKERSVESLLENEIPPTWLFIDEAHTLIPGGNISTPATSAIVEYVKQGRRPGCSLVFATQQPSAIDTRVLSQLDVIMAHKLIFDDDIKAVAKRTPTIIPMRYKHPHFLKTLPVGTALVGDRREETNRAFILKIRPRMSQHEGRDAETGEHKNALGEKDLQRLTVELLLGKLEKEGTLDKETIEQVVHTLNQKYQGKVLLSNVLDALEEKGAVINPKDASVRWPPYFEGSETVSTPQGTESVLSSPKAVEAKVNALTKLVQAPQEEEDSGLQAFPISVTQEQIVDRLLKVSRKSMLGLGKPVEKLQEISLSYVPVWKVEYRQFTGKTSYVVRECFVDAEKGEFLHYINKQFVSSVGLGAVAGLNEHEIHVLRTLFQKGNETIPVLQKRTQLNEKILKHALVKLLDRELIQVKNETKEPIFTLARGLDIPFVGNEKELGSVHALKLVNVSHIQRGAPKLSEDKLHTLLSTLWPNVLVTRVSEIYRPFFDALLVNTRTGEHRQVRLDGFTGTLIGE